MHAEPTAAFGLSFPGLRLPRSIELGHAPTSRFVVPCGFQRSAVLGNEEYWTSVEGSRLRVGWKAYADYVIGQPPRCFANITVDGVEDGEAGLAFVLSVIPLALPLFGLEPLHGSAVQVEGRPVVLLGPSGSGKSTLGSALDAMGYHLIADDAVAFDDEMNVWPGPALVNPRWTDAAQPVAHHYNGKSVRLAGTQRAPVARPPAAVVILSPMSDAKFRIEPLGPSAAFPRILGNARAGTFLSDRRRALQLHVVAGLCRGAVFEAKWDPTSHDVSIVAEALADVSKEVSVP